MVDYPDFSNLGNSSNIGNFLALPNSSYSYFWAWIFAGIWLLITLSLYFKEKERTGKQKFLSSMATSSFVIIFLLTLGSLVGFISLEIMIYALVVNLLIIGVWFFSKS